MEWTDEGVVIGTRRYGETSVIAELMTAAHGRHLGIVRGGRSRRLAPLLQPGNSVQAVWRARLDEHLGSFTLDGLELRAGRLIGSRAAIHGLALLGALLRMLPERDPHPALHGAVEVIVEHLDAPEVVAPLIARFELELLAELGFGLDLESCAATGATQELIYVSPKSGRAVSRRAGEPWAERLLPLPAFLKGLAEGAAGPPPGEVRDAFRTTGFFLERELFAPRGLPLPQARAAFLDEALR